MLCAEYELSLLKRSGNWKSYLPKAVAFANKYAATDYDQLNSIAGTIWENYKDKTTLQKGLEFALRSIKINSNFDNNDTAARLYGKLNDNKNAKLYATTALDLAKKAGVDTFAIEAFLKTLK